MNFTREPIIETVITPRDGCKLVIRNSKGMTQEDYTVDAVEVVSFGHSFFFRSQERPKSFLVPVSDYEVLELKETRMVLKNVTSDRSIKIGGGRESQPPRREPEPRNEPPRNDGPQDETLADSRPAPERTHDQRPMGKRDNKRRRGRRGRDRHPQDMRDQPRPDQHAPRDEERRTPEDHLPSDTQHDEEQFSDAGREEAPKAPSFISKLFPPPTTLIKETLSRYKPQEGSEGYIVEDKTSFEESIFEHPSTAENDQEEDNEE